MNAISNADAAEDLIQKEMEANKQDERPEGCFELFEPREVMTLIGYPFSKAKKGDQEVLCHMTWWPSPDDPLMVPKDTEKSYAEVREKAPKLLVEYF